MRWFNPVQTDAEVKQGGFRLVDDTTFPDRLHTDDDDDEEDSSSAVSDETLDSDDERPKRRRASSTRTRARR